MIRTQADCRARRGVLLISVLVCLALLLVLFGVWIRFVGFERRHLHGRQAALQAEYLAQSGIERAVASLRKNADYRGETWQVEGDLLDGAHSASVVIEIDSPSSPANSRRVRAVAEFPLASRLPARRTREIVVPTKVSGESP